MKALLATAVAALAITVCTGTAAAATAVSSKMHSKLSAGHAGFSGNPQLPMQGWRS